MRKVSCLLPIGLALSLTCISPVTAAAPEECSTDNIKQAVLDDIKAGMRPEELDKKYDYCREQTPVDTAAAAVPGALSPGKGCAITQSNVFWEAIPGDPVNNGRPENGCCGYHPQNRTFTCPIVLKRTTGYGAFGPAPLGSYEHTLWCVDFGGGVYTPVANGMVHVTNAVAAGGPPPWYFATLGRTNHKRLVLPPWMGGNYGTGKAYPARAILTWAWPAPNCNYVPIWGNRADFMIRLDP